jgi:hypothetical protein
VEDRSVNFDQGRIDELVAAPREGLNVEIKRWFDPDEPDGIAKLVRAALAIRNRNGGYMLIGFDDKSLQPDQVGRPPQDVRGTFHLDKIQGLISAYASEAFEIAVGFGLRDGQEYPVIIIPEGVTAPVASKRDLQDNNNRFLVREGEIYFRTLGSNGTPSTSRARPGDWRDIAEICFDNREADIGRFLRRHLRRGGAENLLEVLTAVPAVVPKLHDRATALLDEGEKRFRQAISSRQLNEMQAMLLDRGNWSVALAMEPPRPEALADSTFLNRVSAANPQYTGWPIWLDSRSSSDIENRPVVVEKAWQTLIVSASGWGWSHLDFMRFDPKGEFYLCSVLQDDTTDKVPPGTALDVILVVIRVAEAIAVGLNIAKALGWEREGKLGFAFRWTKLNGRELASWASPLSSITPGHMAIDSTAQTYVEVPGDTAVPAIAPFVDQATRDLFIAFRGYRLPYSAVEHWVQRLLERRLS